MQMFRKIYLCLSCQSIYGDGHWDIFVKEDEAAPEKKPAPREE
jgi:hypothetical protein